MPKGDHQSWRQMILTGAKDQGKAAPRHINFSPRRQTVRFRPVQINNHSQRDLRNHWRRQQAHAARFDHTLDRGRCAHDQCITQR